MSGLKTELVALEYASLLNQMKHQNEHLWLEGIRKDHNHHSLCYAGFLLTIPSIKDMQTVVINDDTSSEDEELAHNSSVSYRAVALWMEH